MARSSKSSDSSPATFGRLSFLAEAKPASGSARLGRGLFGRSISRWTALCSTSFFRLRLVRAFSSACSDARAFCSRLFSRCRLPRLMTLPSSSTLRLCFRSFDFVFSASAFAASAVAASPTPLPRPLPLPLPLPLASSTVSSSRATSASRPRVSWCATARALAAPSTSLRPMRAAPLRMRAFAERPSMARASSARRTTSSKSLALSVALASFRDTSVKFWRQASRRSKRA
mmetsp:Transcript_61350/g.197680  ORF Transcript_61350/g.197680 Transcript_61350/m.197680 type:complete len:230 (-) Transcript_61350:431-1120(-)